MDDGRNVRFQKGVKSMKKMNLKKNFFMKKKIAAGCIAAAALITAGSFAWYGRTHRCRNCRITQIR